MALNPYRERHLLRWQEAERERVSGKNAVSVSAQSAAARISSMVNKIWQFIITVILGVSGTASAILCIALFGYFIFARIIVIQPISVPKSVFEDGLTAEVAASRLKDAIDELTKRAQTFRSHGDVIRQADVLDVTVPSVGISIQSLSTQIRTFLGMQSHQIISGEITSRSGLLFINVRLNGTPLFSSKNGVIYEHLTDLFTHAASAVLLATQPYIFAASLNDTDKTAALEVVDTIIFTSPCNNMNSIWIRILKVFIYTSPCMSEDPIWARILKGNILYEQGLLEEAKAEYKTAIALDPRLSLPHNNLGDILDDQGLREEAKAEYKTAIALDPKFASPHHDLGTVLVKQGLREEAMAEYKTAIALDPTDALQHDDLGNVLDELRRRKEAMAEYKVAITLNPKLALPHYHLGNVLDELSRRKEAMAEYKVAIALDPISALSHNNLGNVLNALGQRDEAIAEYRAAIVFNRKFAVPHYRLGNVLEELGRREEATAEYRAAIAVDHSYALPHYRLGDVLDELGQREEAMAEYRAAIDLFCGISM